MSNISKIILLQKYSKSNSKKNKPEPIIESKIENYFEKIKSNEINKLKNPSKGQIFVHLDNQDNYFFYRFNGKEWLEIR